MKDLTSPPSPQPSALLEASKPARRTFLGATLGAGTALMIGPLLSACGGGGDSAVPAPPAPPVVNPPVVEPPVVEPPDTDPESIAWNTVATAILARIKAPTFPNRDFPITAFGAVAGATVDDATVVSNTRAIKNAIVAANLSGGGRVIVPSGTFMTGAIRLLSNVNLHLPEVDSILLFDTDPRKYPNVLTRWEANDLYNYSPLVYAYRETNIGITGKGTLDGQSGIPLSNPNNKQGNNNAWWQWKSGGVQSQSTDSLLLKAQGAVPGGVSVANRVYGVDAGGALHYLRPPLLGPYGCENVLIEGVKVTRSPFWQIHPLFCKNVIVRDVTMSSLGPNNDGCDPEACVDVLIEKCTFDTGDDCIAIKAGRGTDGFSPPPDMPAGALAPWVQYADYPVRCSTPQGETSACQAATRNIIIRDCVMASGHGGITLGSEMSGGIENIFAENLQMNSSDLDIALRFKTNTRRGGTMRKYYARNITVPNGVSANSGAITIDYFYRADASDDPAESGPYRPFTDQIFVTNLNVGRGTKAGTKAYNIRGFGSNTGAPSPLPPNFVSNTPRLSGTGSAGSIAVNNAIGLVRVRDSVFNVSTTADVIQNVDLQQINVTINRT